MPRLLWAATPHSGAAPFYDLQVVPGDVSVRRNSDQMVTAQLIGLQTQNVRLYARYQSASKWEQVPMRPQPEAPAFSSCSAGCRKTSNTTSKRDRSIRSTSTFACSICPA